jgi:hypothetical protein
MRREISASFQIVSESLSGTELQQRSGLATGVIHNKGESIAPRKGSSVYRQSMVRIDSPLSSASSVEEHLSKLIAAIEPRAAEIANLPAECSRELWFKISHDQGQLGLEIPANDLSILGRLGVAVLFDIYSEPVS